MKIKVNKNVDKFNIKIWILLVLIIVYTMMINIEGIHAFFTNKTITLKSTFQLSYHTLKYSYYEVSGNGDETQLLPEKTSVVFTGTQINISKDSEDIMPENIPKDKNYNKIIAKSDKIEKDMVLLEDQVQKNYTFIMPDNDCEIKVYYYLNKATYTVHFDSNGGTGDMADQVFNIDEQQNLSSNTFSKTGYTFTGWKYNEKTYNDGQLVSNLTTKNNETITLIAQWRENTYTVYFHSNDGNNSTKTQEFNYTDYKQLTSNTFSRSHYTFNGWNTNSSGGGNSYSNNEYVTKLTATDKGKVDLYAQWSAIKSYTYTFYYNYSSSDNSIYSSPTYYDDENVYFPNISRTGYTFLGWSSSRSGSVSYTGGTSAKGSSVTRTTWYARWSEKSYTVYFYPNGGSGSSTSQSFMYSDYKALKKNTFTRTGYAFLGWSKSSSASSPYYDDEEYVSGLATSGSISLYAVWGFDYGYKVNGYVASDGESNWRVFYRDSSNTYIICDNLKAESIDLSGYSNGADVSSVGKSLNSRVSKLFTSSNTNPNIKGTAWLTDTTRWTKWKDKNNKATYAIAGPPMEMLLDSWNEKCSRNEKSKITVDVGEEGYRNTSSFKNFMLSEACNGGIYSSTEYDYWLSSPSDYHDTDWNNVAVPKNSQFYLDCRYEALAHRNVAVARAKECRVRPFVCIPNSTFNSTYTLEKDWLYPDEDVIEF